MLSLVTRSVGRRLECSSELCVFSEDFFGVKALVLESFHESEVTRIGFQVCEIGETCPVSIVIG